VKINKFQNEKWQSIRNKGMIKLKEMLKLNKYFRFISHNLVILVILIFSMTDMNLVKSLIAISGNIAIP
jgi:hypothetical protein